MSNDGQFPGTGNPDPQQPHQPPSNFGSQQGGSWQGPAPQYPPAGGQTPGYGQPQQGQQPPGWNQQADPRQPGWQPGTQQQPAGWGQAPQYGGQPTQYPGQQDQYGNQPPYGTQPGGGAPQQPWGYPPAPGQNEPRKPNRAVIGVVGGVVGVALIAGTVYAVQNANQTAPTPRPSASASVSNGQPQPSVATQKASDVVNSYLRALGSGDAQTALSLAVTAPGDTALLTNAVLANTTAGRITDISVPEVADQNATSVTASYTLAGKPVNTTFDVTNVGGQFRMRQVAAKVDLSSLARVPVTLAGLRPAGDVVQLFPGVYPVKAANRYYSLGSVSVSVADLKDVRPPSRTLAISSAGKSAINKAVSAKYKSCLRQNSLKPAGCALWVRQPSGVTFRKSTISYRTTSGGKWSKAKTKLIGSTVVEGVAKTKVRFNVRDTRGRLWFATLPLVGYRALLGASKVTVTFY